MQQITHRAGARVACEGADAVEPVIIPEEEFEYVVEHMDTEGSLGLSDIAEIQVRARREHKYNKRKERCDGYED